VLLLEHPADHPPVLLRRRLVPGNAAHLLIRTHDNSHEIWAIGRKSKSQLSNQLRATCLTNRMQLLSRLD
jgi:hypothetical protein